MKYFIIKIILFIFLFIMIIISAVYTLFSWVLRNHSKDDWDWL